VGVGGIKKEKNRSSTLTEYLKNIHIHLKSAKIVQRDSELLSGFPWSINGNSDNNSESLCISYFPLV
jgi:hypothetical protein